MNLKRNLIWCLLHCFHFMFQNAFAGGIQLCSFCSRNYQHGFRSADEGTCV